jgi:hypothetical protein
MAFCLLAAPCHPASLAVKVFCTTVWLRKPDPAAAAAAAAGEIMNNVMVEGQRLKFGPMVPKVRRVCAGWLTNMAILLPASP